MISSYLRLLGGKWCISAVLILLLQGNPAFAANIVSVYPSQNALDIDQTSNITATFNEDINAATITTSTFVVHGSNKGIFSGTISYDNPSRTATFNPDFDFSPGEVVSVTLTTGIESSGGTPIGSGYTWNFTAAVTGDGQGYFHLDTQYVTGSIYPTDIAMADFDGDGISDVCVSMTSRALILLGNGDGSFTPHFDCFFSGKLCEELVMADFDGDGFCDMGMAYFGTDEVGILLGNGDGTFADFVAYSVARAPKDIGAGDIDGDGDQDVVVPSYDGIVTILENHGDGSFTTMGTYSIGTAIRTVTVGDFDNDGDNDIAASKQGPDIDSLIILPNLGDGSFGAYSAFSLDINGAFEMTPADFDGDGDVDIVVSLLSARLLVLLNNGAGHFGLTASYPLHEEAAAVLAEDVNSDGALDLITNYVSVLTNDHSGAFYFLPGIPIAGYSVDACAEDIDGDGDHDLLVLQSHSLRFSVLFNNACPYDSDSDGFGDPGHAENECPDDNCPYAYNPLQEDMDDDGIGDICDDDMDDDGVANAEDNCPEEYNPGQEDVNYNGIGDICEFHYNTGVFTDIVSKIEPETPSDTLYVGGEYAFRVFIANDWRLSGMSLGFKIYTEDGATWSWQAQPGGYPDAGSACVTVIPGSRLDPPESVFDLTGLIVTETDLDGISPDTIMVGGVSMMGGLQEGPLEAMYKMHLKIDAIDADAGIVCIDSTFVPPSGAFVFVDAFGSYYPEYDGPFCWPVRHILLGDFDIDGQITVGDVVEMIQVIFFGKQHIAQTEAGDVNCDGMFNVGDAIYLINYIFRFGPDPGC